MAREVRNVAASARARLQYLAYHEARKKATPKNSKSKQRSHRKQYQLNNRQNYATM